MKTSIVNFANLPSQITMEKMTSVLKDFTRHFIVPLCLFFFFKKGIDKILTDYLVKPGFLCCGDANIMSDIAIVLLLLACLLPLLIKAGRGAKLSSKWVWAALAYFVMYLVYRVMEQPFQFTPLSFSKKIKVLDVVNLMPLLYVLSAVVTKITSTFSAHCNQAGTDEINHGFFIDEATTIPKNDDLLGRTKFINELALKIKNTESVNGSFPIGIVAKWGAGKTTFMNSLINAFKGDEFIVIELNVWKCSNSSQMIETLFSLLKSKLSSYSFTINNTLRNYTFNLLKGTKNEGLNGIRNITELLVPEHSVEKQYDDINQEIKRIGKKIIILIDDLDRLDKKEIYEVIRLIRNTANFSNTFFVVAYDRNYILNAIEEINPYQAHYFLEKIFQVEFMLPPIDESIIQREVKKKLVPLLTDGDGRGYEHLLEKGYQYYEYSGADLTALLIHTMRDVVRFINSFKLSYEFVKDEIYFPDFYNLELIRFKHPELFADIYRQYHKFLTSDKENENYNSRTENSYALKMIKDGQGKNTGATELKRYLEEQQTVYKIDKRDISMLSTAYLTLFPRPDNMLTSRTNGPNNHLTVLKPSMFDRYFMLGIEGRLSEVEFSIMRSYDTSELLDKLTVLSRKEDLLLDISQRLQEIKDFDNTEDFEKIVKAIFHFANLPHPNKKENSGYDEIRYDGKSLAFLLGDERNQLFYNGLTEYKNFLLPLMQTNDKKYRYTNDFVSYLLHEGYYYINKILSSEEISELLFNNFTKAIANSEIFSKNLFWHFTRSEIRNEVSKGANTHQIFYPPNNQALRLMRKFVMEKDLDNFLLYSIKETNTGNHFTVENTLRFVFKSDEIFIWLLKRFKGDSKYKGEFLAFFEALKTTYKAEGVPASFFKKIPIKERNF